jgi:acyl-CoA dehydrogenase
MSNLDQFRTETRVWLEENCPESMRKPMTDESDSVGGGRNPTFKHPDQKLWMDRMAAKGWTVPTWPTQYGGAGLDRDEAKILGEEMSRLQCRTPLQGMGISMLGPALLEYGSEEQKSQHMPKIASGAIWWCQGYSEPGAGSDLASLQTKAEDMGDHFLINGSKIWTSGADKADWIFCLVRTDNTGSKHHGISFLLFDMTTPGVTVKPILLISGRSPFCETFFDDVKVPKENLMGERDKGWTIAKYLLTHEREMISGLGHGSKKKFCESAVDAIGLENGRLADTVLRTDIAKLELNILAFSKTMERVGDETKSGKGLGAASAIFKYYGTELNKTRCELMMDIEGEQALGWEGDNYKDGLMSRTWLRSKGNSIEGGTTEVQLNIISKRVLGLK